MVNRVLMVVGLALLVSGCGMRVRDGACMPPALRMLCQSGVFPASRAEAGRACAVLIALEGGGCDTAH